MFPGHRPETPRKGRTQRSRNSEYDGEYPPAALRNPVRAAYRASYAEGENTWSHFVVKAIEAETDRREAEHMTVRWTRHAVRIFPAAAGSRTTELARSGIDRIRGELVPHSQPAQGMAADQMIWPAA
jgi:hypothetical protein